MDSMNLAPYIDNERLADYAVSCARLLKSTGTQSGTEAALRLHESIRELRRCRDTLHRRYTGAPAVPSGCEWLLDNWYMIQREGPAAEDELRRARSLRRCRDGLIITELCRTLLQSGHGRLTEQRCRVFLEAFQSVTVLRRGELYLFPAAMRAAVIQALAAVCRDMLNSSDAEAYAQELETLFSSLRLLSSMDMERLLDSVDVCSAILSRDPTGDYPKMDRETKTEYLRRLEIMAAQRDVEEYTLASELIEKSQAENRHVGFLLLREPGRWGAALYIAANVLLTLFISLCISFSLGSLWLAALLLLPVSELVKAAVDAVAERRAASPAEVFCLRPVNPVRIVAAFSGGRDSTALVDILAKLYHKPHQTQIAEITVVHVHHGLSVNADAWAEHAKAMCEKWRLPLRIEKVYVNRQSPAGIEAAAREARYQTLKRIAHETNSDVIMTGHHLDDRIETFFIQWMRGAGPEGLSAMSPVRTMESAALTERLVLSRPWLDVARSEIESYVKKARLTFVEDDSNADNRFLRNLIRNKVFPELDAVRPGWRAAAARSVTLVAQAADVMKSVGSDDVALCRAADGHSLVIAKLLMLPVARQALCLRSWLAAEGVRPPSKVRLFEALRQVRETHNDSRLTIRCDGREIRRWGADLVLRDCDPVNRDVSRDMDLVWKGESEISLGLWGGVLRFIPCEEGEAGFDAQKLKEGPLFVRSRRGGEKLKLWALRPSRNLKHLYQALKIPSFERGSLPLLWLGGRLIFAAGLGGDVRYIADPELIRERIKLEWVPDKPLLGV